MLIRSNIGTKAWIYSKEKRGNLCIPSTDRTDKRRLSSDFVASFLSLRPHPLYICGNESFSPWGNWRFDRDCLAKLMRVRMVGDLKPGGSQ